jgi:hypothetical protein
LVVDTEPRALRAELDDRNLTVHLADGRVLIVPLEWYPRLRHASPEERQNVEVFADGEELHWPDLDEDIEVVHLIGGRKSGESLSSLERWLAKRQSTVRTGTRAS